MPKLPLVVRKIGLEKYVHIGLNFKVEKIKFYVEENWLREVKKFSFTIE